MVWQALLSKKKIILDLCGGSGNWSKYYKEAGYIVYIITLPDYDVFKTEIRGEYIIFKGEKELRVKISDIYGILAAPTCTMFSFARTTAKVPRDLKQGMKLVIACLNIIWQCRYKTKLAFWCLENPRGYLRQFLGKPVFTFDPCDFGDPYTKKTDLWGYFNLPKKNNIVEPRFTKRFKSGNRMSYFHYLTTLKPPQEAKRLRAITPQGFTRAFYEANK